MRRFEMTFRVELLEGTLEKVWWVRARFGHTIPVCCPHILSSLLIAKLGSPPWY
jgi:hypothetical protein